MEEVDPHNHTVIETSERSSLIKPEKKKRRGCCAILVIISVISLAVLAIIVAYLTYSYIVWSRDFEARMSQTEAVSVDLNSFNYDEQRESTSTKIEDFVTSNEEVSFIELDTEESALLFADTISKSLPQFIKLDKFFLIANDGSWEIYIQIKTANINLPIIGLVIVKDQVEGVEIFVDDVYMGGTDLDSIGLSSIRHNINRAYYDAVLTINDNEFASHSIENIELEEEGIIIKGRRN